MPEIISVPPIDLTDEETWVEVADVSLEHAELHFGCYVTQNRKKKQEDCVAWRTFTEQDLTPKGASTILTPQELGYRLWTSYQILHAATTDERGGCTASTTVYDGKGNLITATVADSVAFAALYDKEDNPLAVLRLNKLVHKPTYPDELKRILEAGGFVAYKRLYGDLAVSRAIGDRSLWQFDEDSKKPLEKQPLIAEPCIDINNRNTIVADINAERKKQNKAAISVNDIGLIKIITTSDGFTDAVGKETKEAQEQYLLEALMKISLSGKMPEAALAKYLVEHVRSQVRDNIGVAIQTITANTPPFFKGVYDGHGNAVVGRYVAQNIGTLYAAQCCQTIEEYRAHPLSKNNREKEYRRDNDEAALDARALSVSQAIQESDNRGKASKPAASVVAEPIIPIIQESDNKREVLKPAADEAALRAPSAAAEPIIPIIQESDNKREVLKPAADEAALRALSVAAEPIIPIIQESDYRKEASNSAAGEVALATLSATATTPLTITPVQRQKCVKVVKELEALMTKYQSNLDISTDVARNINAVINNLFNILASEKEPQDKIHAFYKHLVSQPVDNTQKGIRDNLQLIKQDKNGVYFWTGIILAFLSVPFFIFSIPVYLATGKHALDLLKSSSERLEKNFALIQGKHASQPYGAFFGAPLLSVNKGDGPDPADHIKLKS